MNAQIMHAWEPGQTEESAPPGANCLRHCQGHPSSRISNVMFGLKLTMRLGVLGFYALGIFCCLSTGARGCGLTWTLPANHFTGVDPQGYIAYWESVGEMNCGDGFTVPLHINFNSKRDNGLPSPYLGQGWMLPLLESKFVQESEDRFVMIQPDGLSNLFVRTETGGVLLDGSAGWAVFELVLLFFPSPDSPEATRQHSSDHHRWLERIHRRRLHHGLGKLRMETRI